MLLPVLEKKAQWADYKIDWLALSYLIAMHLTLLLTPFSFEWKYLFSAIALQAFLGGVGMCVGYHRLLTHRSFDTPKWFEHILATLGHLSLQGSPIRWVAMHRMHHQYSDTENDPHSPKQGFAWGHFNWIFVVRKDFDLAAVKNRYAKDLMQDTYYQFLDRNDWWVQIAVSLLVFLALGWKFFIWGICVRLLFTYHTTWFVNSAAHTFGYRNFQTKDGSTNCWWVALLAYGEGWHNNHHAVPHSARHGIRWYEIDTSYYLIRTFKWLHLAKNVKVPAQETVKKMKQAASQKFKLLDPSVVLSAVLGRKRKAV